MESEGDAPEPRGLSRALKVTATCLAAVIAAAAIAAAVVWKVSESKAHGRAEADCSQAVKAMTASSASFRKTVSQQEDVMAVTEAQVKTAGTVKSLHEAVKDPDVASVSCRSGMTTQELRDSAEQARKNEALYLAGSKRVESAAAAVTASRDAKTLDEAKKALSSRKDEASKLLADSDGKVADPATRDALGEEIGKAGRLSSGKPADYRKESDALGRAMDAVKASMQAKADADKAAAEAKADDPSQGGSRGYATQPRRQGYGRGRVYRNPSLPPRRQNVNPPRKQAPVQNNGGDDSWRDWMNNQKPIGNHGCNPDGSCGIG
ncbi:hypothetical protein [Bifidobacterium favimelis]|uniref:Colicin transporter n=1 Tax=Bifidobacterium favimelis TaxID=3122979 RepID=A0ABU8ZL83_9BIFI